MSRPSYQICGHLLHVRILLAKGDRLSVLFAERHIRYTPSGIDPATGLDWWTMLLTWQEMEQLGGLDDRTA